ncbi:MAG: phosphoribosylformylglycinamidine synthase I [Thermaerobacter sp.]|nr:phosphoribosylformylglycinamidine synthase I [Thermaerobacter sp.]
MIADVVVFPGSNCDFDTLEALRLALPGATLRRQWHGELDLSRSDLCVLPGGFAYGDYLRAGALAARSPALREVRRLIERGGLVLGICNGFQVLVEAGILPGAFQTNDVQHFLCRDVHVRVASSESPFLSGLREGAVLQLPIAHQEGNYRVTPREFEELSSEGRIALQYCGADGEIVPRENPNGSYHSIAGVLGAHGRVLGLMPHPERAAWPEIGRADGLEILRGALSVVAEGGRA